jgi:hypothetical protein
MANETTQPEHSISILNIRIPDDNPFGNPLRWVNKRIPSICTHSCHDGTDDISAIPFHKACSRKIASETSGADLTNQP